MEITKIGLWEATKTMWDDLCGGFSVAVVFLMVGLLIYFGWPALYLWGIMFLLVFIFNRLYGR